MYSQNKVDKKTHEAELLTKLCDKQSKLFRKIKHLVKRILT